MTRPATPQPPGSRVANGFRLHHWSERVVWGPTLFALAAGFGQFSVVATLGDVARSFGRVSHGASFSDQAGLSGTELGVGLAVLRLASLGGLPLSGLADRWGRRATLLGSAALGLALTALAALSPSYWWFVAIFALGRPLLSATTAVSQVNVAEHTSSSDRATAVAVVVAGYSVGTGIAVTLHNLAHRQLGFRGVLALAIVPLVLLPFVQRWVVESDRFVRRRTDVMAMPGTIPSRYRGRLAIVATISLALAMVSGPTTGFLFLYLQNVRHVTGPRVVGLVAAAGLLGLVGLVGGRALADRWGRRPTAAMAMAALIPLAILVYSGTTAAAFVGYVLGIGAAAVFAPAAGALVNELFPTEVRASVAGWVVAASVIGAAVGLLVFGVAGDAGHRFLTGALAAAVPPLAAVPLFRLLPETRGREPESVTAT
jgi:MFS family permease